MHQYPGGGLASQLEGMQRKGHVPKTAALSAACDDSLHLAPPPQVLVSSNNAVARSASATHDHLASALGIRLGADGGNIGSCLVENNLKREHHCQRAGEACCNAAQGGEGGLVEGEQREQQREYKHSPVRVANGWLAAALSLLFCAHVVLGAVLMLWPGMPTRLVWVVWVGAAAAAVHVALSAATTYTMFTDTTRPASQRKRSHQKLKWLTGALLAAAVAAHQLSLNMLAPVPASAAAPLSCLAMASAAIFLTIHLCTGVKSLTRDIGLSATARTSFKAVTIACTALAAALLALSCL